MKKFFILILAILLPLSAFEMSADEKEARKIPLRVSFENVKFNNKSDDSQDLNNLMADWSFFDDSEYYPILNINVREYDKVTFSTTINAQAKIGKKLADDISVVAKGTFSYKFENKNKDCGTVMLRYYENPEQNLIFANYGTYITISE